MCKKADAKFAPDLFLSLYTYTVLTLTYEHIQACTQIQMRMNNTHTMHRDTQTFFYGDFSSHYCC